MRRILAWHLKWKHTFSISLNPDIFARLCSNNADGCTQYNSKISCKLPSSLLFSWNITFYTSFSTGNSYISSPSPVPLCSVSTALPQTTTTARQSNPCELVHVAPSYTPWSKWPHPHISLRRQSLLGISSKYIEYIKQLHQSLIK